MSEKQWVLVVDDHAGSRELFRMALRKGGYEVQEACNGKEALDVLARSRTLPGLIVLDMIMPEMDGFEFRRQQLGDKRFAGIPVLVCTGAEDLGKRVQGLQIHLYIKKPYKVDSFLSSVRMHCAPARALCIL